MKSIFQIPDTLTKLSEKSGYPNHSVGMMLASLVACNSPRTILEIGYNYGYSAVWLCSFASPGTKVLSVDINKCDQGEVVKSYGFENHTFLQGNSHEIQPQVQNLMGDEIDLLFIDGDHTYIGAKKDWTIYSPMLSRNGLAVFHDTYAPVIKRVIDEMDPKWNAVFLGGHASLSVIRLDKHG